MIRVFKSTIIQKILTSDELISLVDDFKHYKFTGIPPDNFGRDVMYDHPSTLPTVLIERVKHIHLISNDKPDLVKKTQFKRTSDIHLVYCQGALNENCYLLMTILTPNGHEQAKSISIMSQLGFMAEKFRQQF